MKSRELSISDRRRPFCKLLARFGRDQSGATLIEYGLIVGTISIAILLSMTVIGTSLRDGVFSPVSTAIKSADSNIK